MEPNVKHFHPFGCPVYILQAPLQIFPSGPNDQELEFSVSLAPPCCISSVDSFNRSWHDKPSVSLYI